MVCFGEGMYPNFWLFRQGFGCNDVLYPAVLTQALISSPDNPALSLRALRGAGGAV